MRGENCARGELRVQNCASRIARRELRAAHHHRVELVGVLPHPLELLARLGHVDLEHLVVGAVLDLLLLQRDLDVDLDEALDDQLDDLREQRRRVPRHLERRLEVRRVAERVAPPVREVVLERGEQARDAERARVEQPLHRRVDARREPRRRRRAALRRLGREEREDERVHARLDEGGLRAHELLHELERRVGELGALAPAQPQHRLDQLRVVLEEDGGGVAAQLEDDRLRRLAQPQQQLAVRGAVGVDRGERGLAR